MRMFPNDYKLIRGESGFSNAEKKIFKIFNDMPNTERWVCFHSLRFMATYDSWHAHIDKEVDFIIFIPKKGILFIEIKGGGIEFKNGNFYTTNRNQEQNSIKDPLEQVLKSKHDFIKWIQKKWNIPIMDIATQCVIFPDTRISLSSLSSLPSAYESSHTFCEQDLDLLYTKILGIFTNDLNKQDSDRMDSLLSRLETKDVSAQMSFSSIINYHDEATNQATSEQMRILELLSLCPQAIINGIAGSGKTILALAKAESLAETNPEHKILLVCYTKQLHVLTEKRLKHLPSNLEICHFHGLARKLLGNNFPNNPNTEDWNINIPNAMLSLPKMFDAIFIDEGQDFTENMLAALDCLRNDEDSFFWIFGDTNQNIFSRDEFSFVNYFQGNYVFPLITNCRNPIAITEYSCDFLPGIKYKTSQHALPGIAKHIVYDSEEKQAELIMNLINSEKLAPENTIIITMNPRTKVEDASLFSTKYKNNFEKFDVNIQSKKFTITNLQNFKGMEKSIVILCDVDSSVPEINMYTACSRATTHLYVFSNSSHKQSFSSSKPIAKSIVKPTNVQPSKPIVPFNSNSNNKPTSSVVRRKNPFRNP